MKRRMGVIRSCRIRLPLLSALLALLMGLGLLQRAAAGSDPKIVAQLDRPQVQMGDIVTLTVTVEGGGADGQPSVMNGDGYHSTYQGTSQNFSFVNGRASSTTSYTFRIIPRREGLIHVGPIQVAMDGEKYEVAPLELTVGAAAPTPSQTRNRPQSQMPGRADGGDDIFVTTQVDRDTVYIHQQVVLIFRFYTGPEVSFTERPNYSPPATTGFIEEPMGEQKRFTVRRNGTVYSVTEIKTALYPTRAGVLTISPAEVQCAIEDRTKPTRSPFSIFGRQYREKQKVCQSEPIQVVVRSIPRTGQPADFSGAVGKFAIEVTADATTVKANEAVTITAAITGTGSVNALGTLELPAPESVRIFDSGVKARSIPLEGRIDAEKIFTWILIPTSAEDVTIPPLTLSYFDPYQERFTRAASRPLKIQVLPGESEELITLGGRGLPIVEEDIRYLKTNLTGLRLGSASILDRWLPWIHGLPLLGLGAALVYSRRRRRLERDLQGLRRHGALKSAKDRIRKLRSDEPHRWQRCGAILEDYLADRLYYERHGVQRRLLLEKMRLLGVEDSLMKDLSDFLEFCDASAFAPSAPGRPGDEKPEERTGKLLDRLDADLRGRRV
ncbi:MAG: BatD family protein [Candidatus Eisenbacteria bacterium]|nr:BatD family protein [Candidatus Eisenbacteria bacterium]